MMTDIILRVHLYANDFIRASSREFNDRHCEERSDEAIQSCFVALDRFAALSSGAHTRDPLARNDWKGPYALFFARIRSEKRRNR